MREDLILMGGLGLAVIAIAWYLKEKASDAAGAVRETAQAAWDAAKAGADAVNPVNNDNIINRGATSVYQGATGSTGTIGTDIYDAVQAVKKRVDETNEATRQEADDYGYGWQI